MKGNNDYDKEIEGVQEFMFKSLKGTQEAQNGR